MAMSEQIEGCPQPETPIRERAWTDGQRPEPKYSDAEIIDRVAKAIADAVGHGMREKCEHMAHAAIAAYQLATWSSRPSTPDKAGVSDADVESACRAYIAADRFLLAGAVESMREPMRAALTHFASQSAEAVRDGNGQTLPPGWRIEVRENAGALGLCVFGPVGSFAVDGETSHKSDIRADVIRELRAAMQEQSHD